MGWEQHRQEEQPSRSVGEGAGVGARRE
jgi:hypothetical protein